MIFSKLISQDIQQKVKYIIVFCLFLLPYISCAEYLKNDFRDIDNSINISGYTNIKSDSLDIDIFDDKWLTMPKHNKTNNAYGDIYFEGSYHLDDIKIGVFHEKSINLNANDGFIQTWFYATKDFNTLLNKDDIGDYITNTTIDGDASYYIANGIYIQKIFNPTKKHYFSSKLKLLKGSELQSLAVTGENAEQFEMSFDYYYSDKNHISKNKRFDNSENGIGYAIDLEYIYNDEKLYFHAGFYNIHSFLYWKDIEFMHYDFNGQTIYIGDDGYKHSRPFGSGYYRYDIDYKQKLPLYYRSTLNYKINNIISIGDSMEGYNDIVFNQLYIKTKINKNHSFKTGYIYETKNIIFGVDFKYISLECMYNFAMNEKVLVGGYKIKF
ncbi:MAG: hypothetical protein U9O56_05465 [Campylobacterota bacterium]|nr:hypothetical protein [Campylobacterota bacterium]